MAEPGELNTTADDEAPAPITPVAAAMQTAALDVGKTHEEALAIFVPLKADLKPKHAFAFMRNVQQLSTSNSQQISAVCICCSKTLRSTGATKLVDHLLVCPLCPGAIRDGFKVLREGTTSKAAGKRAAVTLAKDEAEIYQQRHQQAQSLLKQQGILAGLKTGQVAAADLAIANFFYAHAIPFSAASKEPTSLYRTMIQAIQQAPASYIPPNCDKLAGPLLDESYNAMWHQMRERDPDGTLKDKFGSCYVSDGWDSCDNLPLINSAFITANDGGMYWRSVDTSGQTKSAEYCARLMIQDIYAYGPADVVLVITDTCSTMRKAWTIVQAEFPWISVLCCQPHVVALLLKGISHLPFTPA